MEGTWIQIQAHSCFLLVLTRRWLAPESVPEVPLNSNQCTIRQYSTEYRCASLVSFGKLQRNVRTCLHCSISVTDHDYVLLRKKQSKTHSLAGEEGDQRFIMIYHWLLFGKR